MEKNIIILLFLTFFCSCISNNSIKKPDNLINDVPDWFIFGWPKVHEELINLINNKE